MTTADEKQKDCRRSESAGNEDSKRKRSDRLAIDYSPGSGRGFYSGRQ